MAPTASAAIHDPCQSERIRVRLVGGVADRHREGRHVLGRAGGERREEEPAERETSAPNAAVGRSRTDPTLPLRSGRAGGHSRRSSTRSAPYSRRPWSRWRGGPRPGHEFGLRRTQRLGEQLEVRRSRHLDGAEGHQVVGGPLHVEQPGPSDRRPGAARPARPGPPSRRRARGGTSTPPRTARRAPRRTGRRPAGPARPVRRSRPRRCAPSPGRAAAGRPPTTSLRIQPPGRRGSAQPRTTSS